jgi:hypothetical protein
MPESALRTGLVKEIRITSVRMRLNFSVVCWNKPALTGP